ncbi:MAG: HAMP domain-containing histidine kinase [Melioribacteraceae bacterium]|nr:HAMP domain-containing histidine kinase [Melioribacteraceae bacterium]
MKLLNKISRYFLASSIIIFIVGGFLLSTILRLVVLEELDESLLFEKSQFNMNIHDWKNDSEKFRTNSLDIFQVELDSVKELEFKNIPIYIEEEHEFVPFRQLSWFENIDGSNYKIVIRKSLIEQEDLIASISAVFMGVFIAVLIALNLINYFLGKRIWDPFYKNLTRLEGFEFSNDLPIKLEHSFILEFEKLNSTIERMANKIQNDFKILKNFNEDASHEMQTPLAIIKANLDQLIQDENLSDIQAKSIKPIFGAVKRLSGLSRGLGLLTKIENHEYSDTELINFDEEIKIQLENFTELINSKKIKIVTEFNNKSQVAINRFLAETIIYNLLSNAIKHNLENGYIKIVTGKNAISISNSGKPLKLKPEVLFGRLKKDDNKGGSSGLGLSIVKKVCEQNSISITYLYSDKCYQINLKFS